ncbi:MAG: ribonuclease P protein component [Alistipes senegalensis]|nr:ribonuclease P protein component [Oxalobacter formigenes]MCM1280454.1 ribonuclease P protein component [Alistipes senegalensis]
MGSLFSRDRRIVKTDDFSSVFRLKPKKRSAHFILYAANRGLPFARLGLVVARRLAPRAATRNAIKRVCREVFRQNEMEAMDCVVRLSSPVVAKGAPASGKSLKRLVRAEIRQLFSAQGKKGRNP